MATRFGPFETGASTHLANDLVLTMTNEGRLHRQHLSMARRNLSEQEWRLHVRLHGLPLVREAGDHEPELGSGEDVHQAAVLLMEHYAQQIAEGA